MLSLGAVRYQPDSNELRAESKANCYLLISSVFLKCGGKHNLHLQIDVS